MVSQLRKRNLQRQTSISYRPVRSAKTDSLASDNSSDDDDNSSEPDLFSRLNKFASEVQTQCDQFYDRLKALEKDVAKSSESSICADPSDVRRLLPVSLVRIFIPTLPTPAFTIKSNIKSIRGKLDKTAQAWDVDPIHVLFGIVFDEAKQGQKFFVALHDFAKIIQDYQKAIDLLCEQARIRRNGASKARNVFGIQLGDVVAAIAAVKPEDTARKPTRKDTAAATTSEEAEATDIIHPVEQEQPLTAPTTPGSSQADQSFESPELPRESSRNPSRSPSVDISEDLELEDLIHNSLESSNVSPPPPCQSIQDEDQGVTDCNHRDIPADQETFPADQEPEGSFWGNFDDGDSEQGSPSCSQNTVLAEEDVDHQHSEDLPNPHTDNTRNDPSLSPPDDSFVYVKLSTLKHGSAKHCTMTECDERPRGQKRTREACELERIASLTGKNTIVRSDLLNQALEDVFKLLAPHVFFVGHEVVKSMVAGPSRRETLRLISHDVWKSDYTFLLFEFEESQFGLVVVTCASQKAQRIQLFDPNSSPSHIETVTCTINAFLKHILPTTLPKKRDIRKCGMPITDRAEDNGIIIFAAAMCLIPSNHLPPKLHEVFKPAIIPYRPPALGGENIAPRTGVDQLGAARDDMDTWFENQKHRIQNSIREQSECAEAILGTVTLIDESLDYLIRNAHSIIGCLEVQLETTAALNNLEHEDSEGDVPVDIFMNKLTADMEQMKETLERVQSTEQGIQKLYERVKRFQEGVEKEKEAFKRRFGSDT
ncbi:uncharacterized protein CTRU02_215166 [Colletotrichum truncatum]|uniref:Uncharacterized protein n=1 Tax=Colletotrichum truncatum TaxID=5467 RepID=A0ACC3YDQ5_COLTU|nr:uncharacterized protein CTRU02_14222 [Colletotrichum truncatum]KAF6782445.1 hypothetical protein CTRU02_14222 [Colletotrichum truncatum]